MKAVTAFCVLLAVASAASAVHGARPPPRPKSIADWVVANKSKGYGILHEALVATDLLEYLQNRDQNATFFAPTDAAFKALMRSWKLSKSGLLKDNRLDDVMAYHVVPDSVIRTSDVKRWPGLTAKTLISRFTPKGGLRVWKPFSPPGVVRLRTADNMQAELVLPDVRAGKFAIVHGINTVLVPDFLAIYG